MVDNQHYQTLNLDQSATPEQIRKAYLTACTKHHPDRGGDKDAFATIQEANRILSNPTLRTSYDKFGLADMAEIPLRNSQHKLFLGSQEAAKRPKTLIENGITLVMTVACGLEWLSPLLAPHADQIEHRVVPLEDCERQDVRHLLRPIFEAIRDGLKRGNVLVHCQFGVSRSATMVIHFLMQEEGLSYDAALERVQSVRSIAQPGTYFVQQLNDQTHP
eukprot:TRINITY_DN116485_c0_g1_i1.p1 TRINITY_DN116485_c0_g1~~TRINITY_DN116485_c0_g1_i1.p1  ORF type:complete len:232 (-),score=1.77 TRINITY_DN116485_c0_g1_i1:165-818(-)